MSLELTLIKKVQELEAANGELQEKVYSLEELLGLGKEESIIVKEWGLSAQERRVFTALYKNSSLGTIDGKDGIATHRQLLSAAFYERDEPEFPEYVVRQMITRIRKKLTPYGYKIKPVYGLGYSLEKPTKVVIYGV